MAFFLKAKRLREVGYSLSRFYFPKFGEMKLLVEAAHQHALS